MQRPERTDRVGGIPWPPIVLVGAVTVVAVVFVVVQSLGSGGSDGPRVVHDAGFVVAANALCSEHLPALRPPTMEREDTLSPEQAADAVEAAADGLVRLAEQIDELPVVPAEEAAVDGWLVDWRTFADAGRRYASELRTGDVRGASRTARSGDDAQARADRFARANGLDDCQLKGRFRSPPRRSPF